MTCEVRSSAGEQTRLSAELTDVCGFGFASVLVLVATTACKGIGHQGDTCVARYTAASLRFRTTLSWHLQATAEMTLHNTPINMLSKVSDATRTYA